jgi:hypothetical protein
MMADFPFMGCFGSMDNGLVGRENDRTFRGEIFSDPANPAGDVHWGGEIHSQANLQLGNRFRPGKLAVTKFIGGPAIQWGARSASQNEAGG